MYYIKAIRNLLNKQTEVKEIPDEIDLQFTKNEIPDKSNVHLTKTRKYQTKAIRNLPSGKMPNKSEPQLIKEGNIR